MYSPHKTLWRTLMTSLLLKVDQFINKAINVLSRVIYCLILFILHVTYKRLKILKDRNTN